MINVFVIAGYLVLITFFGLKLSGGLAGPKAYFIGENDLPWWAICLSIVAAETSTLTIVSAPGVSYFAAFGLVELGLGYLIGRIVVAVFFLPKYISSEYSSVYQYIGFRFGPSAQKIAATTFLGTRLFAEGVRLFAASIPIKIMLAANGISISYFSIMLLITSVTMVYVYFGGIRAVIWTDAVQVSVYFSSSLICIFILYNAVGSSGLHFAYQSQKLQIFDFRAPFLESPFNACGAILGGAIFAMASHGTDQLIVQRTLAARNLRDGRMAMIGSGFAIIFQFTIFSLIGTLLWLHWSGKSLTSLGISSPDEIFSRFILKEVPPGLSGLMIASILAAAMGSLSAAINSMSNSTVTDFFKGYRGKISASFGLRVSRLSSIGWALLILAIAFTFVHVTGHLMLLALGIAAYTYGALLGLFILGLFVSRSAENDSVISFFVGLIGVFLTGQIFQLAFTWLVTIGTVLVLLTGLILPLFKEDSVGR